MKRIFTLFSMKGALLTMSIFASVSAWSQPLAQWTFEGVTFNTAASTTPSLSAGTTTADVGSQTAGSSFTGLHAGTATVYSTPAGNGSAKAMSSNTWAVGDYYQFQASTTGVSGIAVTFDQTGSNTGPAQFKLQYSTDGTAFTDFATYTIPSNAGAAVSWSAGTATAATSFTFDLSTVTALNNKAAVYFRVVDNGTTSINAGTVAAGGTSRIDNFAIWQASVLPLTLSSFDATFNAGKAALVWKTANESNLRGFSVEKSLNGTSFSEIAFVNATNRAAANTYTVEDAKLKAGANYYRLKIVDVDGAARYSTVAVVNNKSGIKTELFPNPVVNTLTISHDKADADAVIRIVSLEGRQVKAINVKAGASQTVINVNDLSKGNYLMIYESNGEKSTSKFAKQ